MTSRPSCEADTGQAVRRWSLGLVSGRLAADSMDLSDSILSAGGLRRALSGKGP